MVEGSMQQTHRDLWPWQKEVFFHFYIKIAFKKCSQVLATVEAALASQQPGSRPRLERTLKEAEYDFRFLSYSAVILLPSLFKKKLAGIC